MTKVLTTDNMVSAIYRRGMIPSNQNTFTDDDIIEMLNEEFQVHILPMIMKVHEEYYTYVHNETLVSGTSRYEIPYRAIGNKLRDLHYKDTNNNLYEMTRIAPERKSENINTYTNYFGKFYLENNEVVLKSNLTDQNGSLDMTIWLRPNELVSDNKAGLITDIDRTTGIITLSEYPTHFSDLELVDFISHKSPNIILDFDIEYASNDTTLKTITFDPDDIPSKLEVGDYLMKAEETIVPQLPTELIPVLMQRVVIKCLEALGDTEALNNAKQDLAQMEFNINSLIDNRVEGAPLKVYNKHSLLNNASSRYKYRKY